MPTPVLATKLYIPHPRPNVVLRPRLIEQLNAGLSAGRKLTLISAPAGFGKTTLVSEWVDGSKSPIRISNFELPSSVAWLSLDEGDNDLARFLAYLVAALQTLVPKIGEGVLAALQSPQAPPIETLLTTWLNEIAAIPDHFILVLDDYHVIESPPIDQAITFLLEHLPSQMHLVVASREDPQLPLARLRARGQLTELRAADLRFTPAEAADFLNRMMGLSLAAKDIAALETRTEGWIAGLQLAAISMRGRPDAARFIESFTGSHRFVLDYLIEEVLQRQPSGVQAFLLHTSILDRLCGPLCDAVLRDSSASGQQTVEYLDHVNLFIVPLDNERRWYRYHHLFAEVLRARLKAGQPDQVPLLHQRASEWYEQNGLRADAIRHALAAQDFERAAALLELAWPAMEDTFQSSAAWLGWVKVLPDELIRTRPVLSVALAYALLGGGEMEAAEARLTDAERWLEPAGRRDQGPQNPASGMVVVDEDQFRSLPVAIATARAYLAQALGDVPGTVKYAQRVLDLLPESDHPSASPTANLRREQATALLGLTYWANGNLEAAERVFADYTLKLRAAGNLPDAISTTYVLAEIQTALGRLGEAVDTLEQLLQFVIDQGEPTLPDAADLYRGLSELYCERGNLETAAKHLLRSKELGEQAELPVWRYRWCIAQARLNAAQGDLDSALDLLNEAERLFVRTPLPDMRPISAMKARVWVAQGKLHQALRWARERGLSADGELSYMWEFEHLTLARVLIAQYRHDPVKGSLREAMGLLERLLQAAETGGRMGSVIEILLLQALAYEAQGNLSPALVSLERALRLAEPDGYVRLWADAGLAMARLLHQAASRGIAPGYTRQLLEAFSPAGHPSAVRSVSTQLSERELEVLRYIADGLTNREIADRLYLSLYTVKAHARSINDKLEANNRTQAVARARELGVLPGS